MTKINATTAIEHPMAGNSVVLRIDLIERSLLRWRGEQTGATMRTLVTVLLALVAPVTVLAAAGDLNPTRGGGGTATTSFTTGAAAYTLVLLPDGSLAAAGQGNELNVVRCNPNRSLDIAFGSGGGVTTPGCRANAKGPQEA
jgi:hypothetical protein